MHNVWIRVWLAAAVLLVLAACSSLPTMRPTADAGTRLPPPSAAPGSAKAAEDYHIGPQDVLDVSVFGVKDLSGTLRVGGDGMISMPLIGQVEAGGKTTGQLQKLIAAKLSEGYLQDPQVTVFVKDFASQQITVEGSVGKPGIYPLTGGDTSLMQAVALAGGLTRLAEDNGVVVFRQIQGKQMAAVFNYSKISEGHAADPRIYAGDVIMVQQSGSKNALENFIRAAPAIGLFLLY